MKKETPLDTSHRGEAAWADEASSQVLNEMGRLHAQALEEQALSKKRRSWSRWLRPLPPDATPAWPIICIMPWKPVLRSVKS